MPTRERRFRDLVSASGNPVVVTLWTAPNKDRAFMKAVKENRVLTVVQEPLSKRKDYGLVGFHEHPHASYLVFPKPLSTGQQARVVGINYDLVRQPKPAGRLIQPGPQPGPRRKSKSASAEKLFHVIIRRVALLESSLTVQGRSKTDASAKAVEAVRHEPFDLSKAVITNEVRAVQ